VHACVRVLVQRHPLLPPALGATTRLIRCSCCRCCSPDGGPIPTLRQLGFSAAAIARCAADGAAQGAAARGGEGEALRQLQSFMRQLAGGGGAGSGASGAGGGGSGRAANGGGSGAFATSFSCRISPWLATGCLSPRQMYQASQQSSSGSQQQGMSWLYFELLWRDFFRFINAAYTAAGVNAAAVVPA